MAYFQKITKNKNGSTLLHLENIIASTQMPE